MWLLFDFLALLEYFHKIFFTENMPIHCYSPGQRKDSNIAISKIWNDAAFQGHFENVGISNSVEPARRTWKERSIGRWNPEERGAFRQGAVSLIEGTLIDFFWEQLTCVFPWSLPELKRVIKKNGFQKQLQCVILPWPLTERNQAGMIRNVDNNFQSNEQKLALQSLRGPCARLDMANLSKTRKLEIIGRYLPSTLVHRTCARRIKKNT